MIEFQQFDWIFEITISPAKAKNVLQIVCCWTGFSKQFLKPNKITVVQNNWTDRKKNRSFSPQLACGAECFLDHAQLWTKRIQGETRSLYWDASLNRVFASTCNCVSKRLRYLFLPYHSKNSSTHLLINLSLQLGNILATNVILECFYIIYSDWDGDGIEIRLNKSVAHITTDDVNYCA